MGMRPFRFRLPGILLCLLYLGQVAIIPTLHLAWHGLEASVQERWEDCRNKFVLAAYCEGPCSDPIHHHHHHDPGICTICNNPVAGKHLSNVVVTSTDVRCELLAYQEQSGIFSRILRVGSACPRAPPASS